MSEYIKREDAKQVATSMYLEGQVSVQFCNAIHSKLDKVPSADVVEVVRCKDCKYNADGTCEYTEINVKDNDYCSYGERKEQEHE